MTSMSWHLGPAIRSCECCQWILCFKGCQLTIIWKSIIKLNTSYSLPQQLESLTFHIGFPVERTDGPTVTCLLKFLGWIDNQIFLGMKFFQVLFLGSNFLRLEINIGSGYRPHAWFSSYSIGHFRVPPGLCFKTREAAQPLIQR